MDLEIWTKKQEVICFLSSLINIDKEAEKVIIDEEDYDVLCQIYGFKTSTQVGVHFKCIPEIISSKIKVSF